MTKVYLLKQRMNPWPSGRGETPVHQIHGVFSDERQAEASMDGCQDFMIESFDLDGIAGQVYGIMWQTTITKAEGRIRMTFSTEEMRHPDQSGVRSEDLGDEIRVWSPISREHVIEVANEKRQEWARAFVSSYTTASSPPPTTGG